MLCYYCCRDIVEGDSALHGLHRKCFIECFHLEEPVSFTDLARKSSETDKACEVWKTLNSSFFQGKFRKYSALLAGERYILKVEEKDYPELPAVEYLCNQIAEALKLAVPAFQLIEFHGRTAFAVKNFISGKKVETLHHIYHYLNGKSYNCSEILSLILEQTGRISEAERFVELCLFDSLVGNHDRHGRNLGFIETPGRLTLSPFYDNPSYIGVEEEAFLGADHSPKGRIATELTDEPVMKDYIVEFTGLGYEDSIKSFRRKLLSAEIFELSGWLFLTKKRMDAMRTLISKRIRQMSYE